MLGRFLEKGIGIHNFALLRNFSNSPMTQTFKLETFCLRQFDDPNYTGTHVNFEKKAFEQKINELYESNACQLVDGYAPFCKHLFVENFTDSKTPVLEISSENESLLTSAYEARTTKELPVLVRWFPADKVTSRKAKFLDIILYSKEQIDKENEAMGAESIIGDSPWGIISVKAQDVNFELPMNPITILRNALGKNEGGSGVPLVREKYMESVEYWKKHAVVK